MGSQYGTPGAIREAESIDVLGLLDLNVLRLKLAQRVRNLDAVGSGDEWTQCGTRFVSL
jgi:hypothetical protein